MDTNNNKFPRDTKRIFLKNGPCSTALFHILNRNFGHIIEEKEKAAEPLAGGIMQEGYQCGMLWGASLAAGAESYRRCDDPDKAIGMAVRATQRLVESFEQRTNTVRCSVITGADWSNKLSFAKYFFSGKFLSCFKLAEKWAPEAIETANTELASGSGEYSAKTISCASEVLRRMGASDEDIVTVAGFAGGLGLSGSGCGALSAVIWMKSQSLLGEGNGRIGLRNPELERVIKAFRIVTGNEMECKKITGYTFGNVSEHSEYIKNGGCDKLINALAGE